MYSNSLCVFRISLSRVWKKKEKKKEWTGLACFSISGPIYVHMWSCPLPKLVYNIADCPRTFQLISSVGLFRALSFTLTTVCLIQLSPMTSPKRESPGGDNQPLLVKKLKCEDVSNSSEPKPEAACGAEPLRLWLRYSLSLCPIIYYLFWRD